MPPGGSCCQDSQLARPARSPVGASTWAGGRGFGHTCVRGSPLGSKQKCAVRWRQPRLTAAHALLLSASAAWLLGAGEWKESRKSGRHRQHARGMVAELLWRRMPNGGGGGVCRQQALGQALDPLCRHPHPWTAPLSPSRLPVGRGHKHGREQLGGVDAHAAGALHGCGSAGWRQQAGRGGDRGSRQNGKQAGGLERQHSCRLFHSCDSSPDASLVSFTFGPAPARSMLHDKEFAN